MLCIFQTWKSHQSNVKVMIQGVTIQTHFVGLLRRIWNRRHTRRASKGYAPLEISILEMLQESLVIFL